MRTRFAVAGLICMTCIGAGKYAQAAQLGSFFWSPEIAIGAPQPLQLGLVAYCLNETTFCRENLKYYLEGGYALFSTSKISVDIGSIELGARYSPFSFPLYFGMGVGYRHIGIDAKLSSFQLEDAEVTGASLLFSSLYVTPSAGMEFELSPAISIGFDLGVQLSVIYSGNLVMHDSQAGTNDQLAIPSSNALDHVAKITLFRVTLARLVWHF